LSAFDAVPTATPASWATSLMVAGFPEVSVAFRGGIVAG
jgi:hypothetical protein